MKKVKKIVTKEEILNQLKIDLISTFFHFSNEDILKYKEVYKALGKITVELAEHNKNITAEQAEALMKLL